MMFREEYVNLFKLIGFHLINHDGAFLYRMGDYTLSLTRLEEGDVVYMSYLVMCGDSNDALYYGYDDSIGGREKLMSNFRKYFGNYLRDISIDKLFYDFS